MTAEPRTYACIESAWQAHRDELRSFLLKHSGDRDAADDLLQGVYAKALTHRTRFCQLDSPRAWLFRVARHQWIDEWRRKGRWVDGDPPELPSETETHAPVDSLVDCIERALPRLSQDDRDILSRCDLGGLRQADYAELNGLGLPATKARLRRARQRLRERLIEQCEIAFDAGGHVCCHKAEKLVDLS